MKELREYRAAVDQAIKDVADGILPREHAAHIEHDLDAEQNRIHAMAQRYAQQFGTSQEEVTRIFTKWQFISSIPQTDALARAEQNDGGWETYLQESLGER